MQICLGRHAAGLSYCHTTDGRSVHLNIRALDFNRMVRFNSVCIFYMVF